MYSTHHLLASAVWSRRFCNFEAICDEFSAIREDVDRWVHDVDQRFQEVKQSDEETRPAGTARRKS